MQQLWGVIMSYDIGGGYDGWKLSTPWDDEVEVSVSFECKSCEVYNENVDAVAGRRDEEVYVECVECGVMNTADTGAGDW
jgi:hypothetical protein